MVSLSRRLVVVEGWRELCGEEGTELRSGAIVATIVTHQCA